VLLHYAEKLDDDLRTGSDEDLALTGPLGIIDRGEGIVENRGPDHFDTSSVEILKSGKRIA
jgi:hypothetical protein